MVQAYLDPVPELGYTVVMMNKRDSVINYLRGDITPHRACEQLANAYRLRDKTNLAHKDIVEAGGGIYVPGMMLDLVLFNSPKTGSTLALEEKDLTADAVSNRICASDKTFGV